MYGRLIDGSAGVAGRDRRGVFAHRLVDDLVVAAGLLQRRDRFADLAFARRAAFSVPWPK
jgi:hypothetical protein